VFIYHFYSYAMKLAIFTSNYCYLPHFHSITYTQPYICKISIFDLLRYLYREGVGQKIFFTKIHFIYVISFHLHILLPIFSKFRFLTIFGYPYRGYIGSGVGHQNFFHKNSCFSCHEHMISYTYVYI
jgi:hypothetical protein